MTGVVLLFCSSCSHDTENGTLKFMKCTFIYAVRIETSLCITFKGDKFVVLEHEKFYVRREIFFQDIAICSFLVLLDIILYRNLYLQGLTLTV